MKKHFFGLFIFCNYLSLNAQTIDFFGGITKNKFYDIQDDRPGNSKTYSSGNTVYFGLGLHKIKVSDIEFGITISYEKFGGDIKGSSGGLGGGITTIATVDKSILSFGIFPFHKKVYNNLNLSIGIVLSGLLRESFSGSINTYISGAPELSSNENLNDKYKSFSASTYIGAKATLSYDFNVSENIILAPHYTFYIGLAEEFQHFPRPTKSMRHFMGIGIKRKLK